MKFTNGIATAFVLGTALLINGCKKDDPTPVASVCYLTSLTETGTQGGKTETFGYSASNQFSLATITIDGASPITLTPTFDAQGRLSKVVASYGYTTTYSYNASNQLEQTVTSDNNGVNNNKVVYTYNGNGQVTRLDTYGHVNGDAELTLITHDVFTYPNATTQNPDSEAHYVDSSGTGLTTTDYFEFDSKKIPSYDGSTGNNITKITSKNKDGNVVNTTSYAYEYNANDYPTKETMNSTGNDNGLSPQSSVINYVYNCN